MNQLNLFDLPSPDSDRPAPRNQNPQSINAAQAQIGKSGTVRRTCYELIKQRGGLTNYELASLVNRPVQTTSARVNELTRGGWVKRSGATRPSPYGQPATVWITTDKNEDELGIKK